MQDAYDKGEETDYEMTQDDSASEMEMMESSMWEQAMEQLSKDELAEKQEKFLANILR